MSQFTREEVHQVLSNLRYRWPNATVRDALTILQDTDRALRAEAAEVAADAAVIEVGFDGMAAQ